MAVPDAEYKVETKTVREREEKGRCGCSSLFSPRALSLADVCGEGGPPHVDLVNETRPVMVAAMNGPGQGWQKVYRVCEK